MAKEIENSLITFDQRDTSMPAILSAGVLVVLLAGLVTAIYSQNWILAAIFVFSIAGLAGFAYMSLRRPAKLTSSKDRSLMDWETALPEIQRQNLSIEVFELAKILEVEAEQIGDLQSAYIVAEDLALRQIQQEENVPLMRHVSLGKAPFDALLVKGDMIICVEVSFLVAPDIRQEKVDAMMRKIALVKSTFEQMKIGMKVRLMMVLVTQLTPEDGDHLRSALNTRRFSTTPVDIDIRLLDFEALQKIYVTD
ncbi:MAG: hypothetical protein H7070_01485 [Saprospiraceae bacterium]|nr:hypothetical protein [Pyrinomonadaceae bacterium]